MKTELTELQETILKIVSKAKKPATRPSIQFAVYGTTNNRNNDRAIQNAIKALRDLGYVIVSNSDHQATSWRPHKRKWMPMLLSAKAAAQMIKTAMKVRKAFQQRGQMRMAGA